MTELHIAVAADLPPGRINALARDLEGAQARLRAGALTSGRAYERARRLVG